MRAPLTFRELRHMANESVIIAEAKRHRQSRTQGEGVDARLPIGSGRLRQRSGKFLVKRRAVR